MLTAVSTASAQGAPKERYQFDSDLPPTEVPPSSLKVSTGGVNLAVLTAASVRHHFAARAKAAHFGSDTESPAACGKRKLGIRKMC